MQDDSGIYRLHWNDDVHFMRRIITMLLMERQLSLSNRGSKSYSHPCESLLMSGKASCQNFLCAPEKSQ